jgi:hypothetical protein
MELTSAGSVNFTNATEIDIRTAFADDAGRDEFIILSQSELTYMQASGECEGPYTLEYQDASTDKHYQCPDDLNKDQVQAAFLKYLNNDTSWRTGIQWQLLENKPWWKFW